MITVCDMLTIRKGGSGWWSGGCTGCRGKWKKVFIKHDVPRNINVASRMVQSFVALVQRTITQEHALCREEREFMIVIRAQIWPARAAEGTKESVIGWLMK
jgi:hypothetical protein